MQKCINSSHYDSNTFDMLIDNKKKRYEDQDIITVWDLYKLSYDEVLIIDPEISISKEEYENIKL